MLFDLDEEKMSAVISSFQIPVKPEILSSIQKIMTEDEPSIEDISSLIFGDVGLSAAILKIINSPFYGMNRRISEIKQAVMMLGIKTVNGLVTALLLKASFKGDACISLERFWDDAQDVANAMTYIGNKIKNELPVDMLYTIGLFQNCGIPLLALKHADYIEILSEANRQNVNSITLEEARYRTNHAVLGYYVATSWHLPKEICQLILQHHDSGFFKQPIAPNIQLAFAALKTAENMVEKVKRYNPSPDWDEIGEEALDILGISPEDYSDIEDDFAELF
ncbi:MAG: HDOD domain-containing protein [Colwellia sp.]|nr:HDOD domain-containing protein [Colwellia sp.]